MFYKERKIKENNKIKYMKYINKLIIYKISMKTKNNIK